jgi:hypothetical protein
MLSDRSIDIDGTNSFLNLSQSQRLCALLDSPVLISSQRTLPTLTVIPSMFLIRLKLEAQSRGLVLHDVRLSGGAASFVLDPSGDLAFRDLDFFISLTEISSDITWHNLKQAVFASLPLNTRLVQPTNNIYLSTEHYTEKIVRIITDQDRWALISLRNVDGRNLELVIVNLNSHCEISSSLV